jgi:hypothetical protein
MDGISINTTEEDCVNVFNDVDSLTKSSASSIFVLTKEVLGVVKSEIKKSFATHIRIHRNGDKLRISIFDIRKFNQINRLRRERGNVVKYLDIKKTTEELFSYTLFAQSFAKLKSLDYQVRLGTNGVVHFSDIDDSLEYFFRDQKIHEPMTIFHSQSVNQDIAFLFDSNLDQED